MFFEIKNGNQEFLVATFLKSNEYMLPMKTMWLQFWKFHFVIYINFTFGDFC